VQEIAAYSVMKVVTGKRMAHAVNLVLAMEWIHVEFVEEITPVALIVREYHARMHM